MRVAPISLLEIYPTASLYYGDPDQPRDQREVPVAELTAILARATWQSRTTPNKGGFWLQYPDGRDLFVAIGFDLFKERGVDGQFMIRPEDRSSYREALAELTRQPRT